MPHHEYQYDVEIGIYPIRYEERPQRDIVTKVDIRSVRVATNVQNADLTLLRALAVANLEVNFGYREGYNVSRYKVYTTINFDGVAPDIMAFLNRHRDVCLPAKQWIVKQPSLKEAWETCPHPSWLMWAAVRDIVEDYRELAAMIAGWLTVGPVADALNTKLTSHPVLQEYRRLLCKALLDEDWEHDELSELLSDSDIEKLNDSLTVVNILDHAAKIVIEDDKIQEGFCELPLSVYVLFYEMGQDRAAVAQWMCESIRAISFV